MVQLFSSHDLTLILIGLEILDDHFEQFFYYQILFLVERLDLRYLLIFFEIFGQLLKGTYEIRYHSVLFLLTSISQLLYRIYHHDELL